MIKEIMKIVAEGWDYFKSIANLADLFAYGLVIVCQWYYWRTGRNEFGYFVPDEDSYF